LTQLSGLHKALSESGFVAREEPLQGDEYYGVPDRSLSVLDYVIRPRLENKKVLFTFKGPPFFTGTSDYSRLEFRFPMPEDQLRAELGRHGLVQTWFFEKRRTDFRRAKGHIVLSLDEIPEIGRYAEIEGPLGEVRKLADEVAPFLGSPETQNYQVLFIDYKERQGHPRDTLPGAAFPR
jgi:adenylate cyclase class IV